MVLTLSGFSHPATWGFDDIIDVRAPAEFAEDHLPGAISLPVLDDDERARVGTIYKQVSPFTARKLGAALVARNAARHLEGPLADRPGGWRPLVYCWRGGQRSGSFATILGQIGWRVETLQGGYKAWRQTVVDHVYSAAFPAPVVVIDGNTGSGKTALLAEMARRGHQVVDLEGLARHRGSLFGGLAGGQPSQRAFERGIALATLGLDPARPVLVEAESSAIGLCRIPAGLWKAMARAPRIEIALEPAARAAFLVGAYPDLVTDPERTAGIIAALRPMHPGERIAEWTALAAAGRFAALAESLMRHHYDPRYARHRARSSAPVATVALAGPVDIAALGDRVEAALASAAVASALKADPA
jgi:tRNA 2-selenouridine synthase